MYVDLRSSFFDLVYYGKGWGFCSYVPRLKIVKGFSGHIGPAYNE